MSYKSTNDIQSYLTLYLSISIQWIVW